MNHFVVNLSNGIVTHYSQWILHRVEMKLLTAHKILISSAVVFFIFFAFWEFGNYSKGADSWAAWRSGLYLVIAVGFGVYLKNLKRWYK